jgi:hypothetical protein
VKFGLLPEIVDDVGPYVVSPAKLTVTVGIDTELTDVVTVTSCPSIAAFGVPTTGGLVRTPTSDCKGNIVEGLGPITMDG